MSFFAAAMWSASALLVLDLLTQIVMRLRPTGQLDLVSGVLCQSVAFLLSLLVMVSINERDRSLSDFLGMRRPHIGLCFLAVAIGIALHGPLTILSNAIYSRYPPPAEQVDAIRELFNAPTVGQKVALAAAAGLLGPFVEEMFFRGGILRSVRRTHPVGLTVFGVALLFAAAHLDLRNFVPTLLGGLAMGYVRVLSGSLWPSVLLHATFNSGSVFVAFAKGPDGDLFTSGQGLLATAAAVGLVALFGYIAMKNERCAEARALDVT